MSEPKFKGSCLCGSIKFTLIGKPLKCLQCWCTRCQKNAGAENQIMVAYANVEVSDLHHYERIYNVTTGTESGKPMTKHFCGNCGCTLWTIPMLFNGECKLVRTSLVENGLALWKPTEIYCNDARTKCVLLRSGPGQLTVSPDVGVLA